MPIDLNKWRIRSALTMVRAEIPYWIESIKGATAVKAPSAISW